MFNSGFLFPDYEFKETGLRSPHVNMHDFGKPIKIVAELPGFKDEKKNKNFYYRERSFEEFNHSVSIPDEVSPGKAEADFKNGMLNLKIPKVAHKKDGKGPLKAKIK